MTAYAILAVWPPKRAKTDDAAIAVVVPKNVHVITRADPAD
jgi:hypothetical protein